MNKIFGFIYDPFGKFTLKRFGTFPNGKENLVLYFFHKKNSIRIKGDTHWPK